MRGPGPKWHAKHTASLAAAAGVQPVVHADAPRAILRAGHNAILPGAMPEAVTRVLSWIGPTAAAAAVGFMAVMALA